MSLTIPMGHHASWQELAAQLFAWWVLYTLLTGGGLLAVWLGWPYVTALLVIASFGVLTFLGPWQLSWNRAGFGLLVPAHFAHQALAVMLFALHYSRAGLWTSGGGVSHGFSDGLYFSLAVWTTLGAPDLAAVASVRWLPVLEAFTGLIFVPVLAALLWELLGAMTPPKGGSYMERLEGRRLESRQWWRHRPRDGRAPADQEAKS
jgi:hypothetical protein